MKVILLQEVAGLGKPGDVKNVANGYARNFLLPRNLVTAATPGELTRLHEHVAAVQRQTEKQRAEHESLAAHLNGVTLTFAVRVGRGDRLYGSVTSQDIANALREQEKLTIDRRTIHLREPLRQLGTFEVPIRIATQIEARVKVSIIASDASSTEDSEEQPEAPEATEE